MSVARTDKEILCATEVYVNMNQTYLHESQPGHPDFKNGCGFAT